MKDYNDIGTRQSPKHHLFGNVTRPEQARAAIELLDGGSTVPFIACYRKEATCGLDDGQLQERLTYLRGVVSIARWLQDSLAELVKIEPKSIDVGQCQHNVDQGACLAVRILWWKTR